MPQVVNGIGTWYHGKRNRIRYEAICQFCGNTALLETYDTTLYFVVIFIPVIPLKKLRVFEKCPRCTRHRVLELSKWHAERAERCRKSMEEWRQNPNDETKAIGALRQMAIYQAKEELDNSAPEIAQTLAANPEVLRTIGDIYDDLNEFEKSENYLRAALRAKDDEPARELLVYVLARQGKLDEAEDFSRHIIDKGIPDRANLLFSIAEGWQAKGEHTRALLMFDQIRMIAPAISQNKEYIKARKFSEKHRASKTRRVSKRVKQTRQGRLADDAPGTWGKWIAPAIGVFLLGLYLWTALQKGQAREVWLVGGLDKTYKVKINGQEFTVDKLPQKIKLPEGRWHIVPAARQSNMPEPVDVTLKTNFFIRPFDSGKLVLNPDRAALLEVMPIIYYAEGTQPSDSEKVDPDFFTGQAFYRFKNIHYTFEQEDERIRTEDHSKRTARRRLDLASRMSSVSSRMLHAYVSRRQPELLKEHLKRRLALEPDLPVEMQSLAALTDSGELIEFLRPHLPDRPVLLEWHRAYIKAMEEQNREDQLKKEYQQQLAVAPNDPDLLYLAGRTELDANQAVVFYTRSAAAPNPNLQSLRNLVTYHSGLGRFAEAEQILEAHSDSLSKEFRDLGLWLEVLEATKKYDAALDKIKKAQAKAAPDELRSMALSAVYLEFLKGNEASARERLKAESARLEHLGMSRHLKSHPDSDLLYLSGQPDKIIKEFMSSEELSEQFIAAITSGSCQLAASKIEGSGDESAYLVASILAEQRGFKDIAQKELKLAANEFRKRGGDDRLIADALTSGTVQPEMVMASFQPISSKRIILTALGLRDAAHRDQYFALARQLNFDRHFPYHFLNSVLNETH